MSQWSIAKYGFMSLPALISTVYHLVDMPHLSWPVGGVAVFRSSIALQVYDQEPDSLEVRLRNALCRAPVWLSLFFDCVEQAEMCDKVSKERNFQIRQEVLCRQHRQYSHLDLIEDSKSAYLSDEVRGICTVRQGFNAWRAVWFSCLYDEQLLRKLIIERQQIAETYMTRCGIHALRLALEASRTC
ncbi:hypothetical protein KCU89_g141, partial [Aureobasidium melanogenum]